MYHSCTCSNLATVLLDSTARCALTEPKIHCLHSKLLAVDAANMRGWMTQFTVASINAALVSGLLYSPHISFAALGQLRASNTLTVLH